MQHCLPLAVEPLADNWRDAFTPEGDAYKGIEQHFRFNNGTEPATRPTVDDRVPEGRLRPGDV